MCLAAVSITLPNAWPVLEVLAVLPLLPAYLNRVGQLPARLVKAWFCIIICHDSAGCHHHDSQCQSCRVGFIVEHNTSASQIAYCLSM